MGLPRVDRFTVHINFNDRGEPETVQYGDDEGCGHWGPPVKLHHNIGQLVSYHVTHARKHGIKPRIMCDHVILGRYDTELKCVLEKHGPEVKHQFEI